MGASRIIPAHPEHIKFTEAVGEALHQWSMVEMALATLFETTSLMPDYRAAQAVMAAVQSLPARVKMCAALLSFLDLRDDLQKHWKNIGNMLLEKNARRNELAHFSILQMRTTDGQTMWRLVPYFSIGLLATESRKDAEMSGLTVDEVKTRGIQFSFLGQAVAWFNYEVRIFQGTLEANPRPMPDLLRQSQSQDGQTGAKRQRRPRPPRKSRQRTPPE